MVWVAIEANVELTEIDDSVLVEHLESRGYTCNKLDVKLTRSEYVCDNDLHRIDHLFLCGQKQAAISEIFDVVGRAIGRQITH